jgi:hypothetical protein
MASLPRVMKKLRGGGLGAGWDGAYVINEK